MAKDYKKTSSYELFTNGYSFLQSIDLHKKIARSILFENGEQWNMDEDIDEFTKITLNIIKQIGKTRKSYVMQNEYSYLVNSTNFREVRKIQDFLKYEANRLNLKRKDIKILSDDFTKGTGLGYFYWDKEKSGFLRNSGGKLCYQVLDIRRLVVANPYVQSIQDQEWIIYAFPEKIGALKKKYGADKVIIPDGYKYTSDTEKPVVAITEDDEIVNVYAKFFKNEIGEVFYTLETEFSTLQGKTPMNPFYEGDDEEQPSTTMLMDKKETKEEKRKARDKRANYVWNLYPFVTLVLNEKDNLFYGSPIAYEYIEAQKSINNHFSVFDKALQDNVLGGFIYRKGVLGEQEITTESGQMIALDLQPSESVRDAFDRMPIAQIPADSINYSARLIDATRAVGGASNVQLGMSDYAGQSGKQTQFLLERARANSTESAILFNEFKKDQAYIMFLFAKFYYDNEEFVIIEHGMEKDNVRSYTQENAFNGTKYLDDKVLIDIRVGASPSFSEYSNLEILGLSLQSGQIPLEAYIQMLPEGYISNKQEILRIVENNSKKQIEQLQQKLLQQEQVMAEMVKAYEKAKKDMDNIDTIIAENNRLKSMMAEVSANAVKKVQEVTAQNKELLTDMKNTLKIIQKNQ